MEYQTQESNETKNSIPQLIFTPDQIDEVNTVSNHKKYENVSHGHKKTLF